MRHGRHGRHAKRHGRHTLGNARHGQRTRPAWETARAAGRPCRAISVAPRPATFRPKVLSLACGAAAESELRQVFRPRKALYWPAIVAGRHNSVLAVFVRRA